MIYIYNKYCERRMCGKMNNERLEQLLKQKNFENKILKIKLSETQKSKKELEKYCGQLENLQRETINVIKHINKQNNKRIFMISLLVFITITIWIVGYFSIPSIYRNYVDASGSQNQVQIVDKENNK